MQSSRNVIGISLGTRQLGIACFTNNRLSDWRTHSFRYAWSSFKKKQILRCIETLLKQQHASVVALKITEPEKQTSSYKILLTDLEMVLFQQNIHCYVYTIDQLKVLVSTPKQQNKTVFMEGMLELYPELRIEFEKERTNTTSYYIKIFEAIAAAHLCQTTK